MNVFFSFSGLRARPRPGVAPRALQLQEVRGGLREGPGENTRFPAKNIQITINIHFLNYFLQAFHERGGFPHCKPCYVDEVCSKCAGCLLPITDRALKAMEADWHVECFVCKVRYILWPVLKSLPFKDPTDL